MDYEDLVQSDLELMRLLLQWLDTRPIVASLMRRLINKHPWRDVCASIWVCALLGIIEVGANHIWVVSSNLSFAFVLQKVVAARRPVEFDRNMQPLTNLNAESFGFPSIESYMSVVKLL